MLVFVIEPACQAAGLQVAPEVPTNADNAAFMCVESLDIASKHIRHASEAMVMT